MCDADMFGRLEMPIRLSSNTFKAFSSDGFLLNRLPESSMADNIDISPATRDDISTLAAIWPVTMRTNPVMNFIFPSHIYDSSAPFAYILRVYEKASLRRTNHFLKATHRKSGEITGFALFKVEAGETRTGSLEKSGLNEKEEPPLPENTDKELYDLYFGGRARKEEMHMAAQNYAGRFCYSGGI